MTANPAVQEALDTLLPYVPPAEQPAVLEGLGEPDRSLAARRFRLDDAAEVDRITRRVATTGKLSAEDQRELMALSAAGVSEARDVMEGLEAVGIAVAPQALPAVTPAGGVSHFNAVRLNSRSTAPALLAPRAVVPGVDRGASTTFTGAPGSGKSAKGLSYAVAVAHEAANVLGLSAIDHCGDVLIVLAEDRIETALRRITALKEHFGLPWRSKHEITIIEGQSGAVQLFGRNTAAEAPRVLPAGQALLDATAGRNFALIIVDTASAAFAGIDENSASDVTAAMGFCNQLAIRSDAAILLISHTSKGAGSQARDQDHQRGSRAWTASARNVIGLSVLSDDEARKRGLSPSFPGQFIEAELVKTNHGRAGPLGAFKKVSVSIAAVDPRKTPPDTTTPVVVLEPVTPGAGHDPLSTIDLPALLNALRRGIGGDPKMLFARSRKTGRAAVHNLLSTDFGIADNDQEAVVQALIARKHATVETRTYDGKGHQRQVLVPRDDAATVFDDRDDETTTPG